MARHKNNSNGHSDHSSPTEPLVEVRSSPVHGRGVYATQPIRKGTAIIEYTGERVAWEDAPNDQESSHTFNFGLTNGLVINPAVGGNDSRWINHSCDPNCEAIEDEEDRVYIHALRNIAPGEELFYDYGLEIDEPVTEEQKKEHECLCRSKKCRGTLLALPKKKKKRPAGAV